MIFSSLARVDECVHVHNVRYFPEAKLDSEINVCFLFNEHGDLLVYFLLHNNIVHVVLCKMC